MARPRTDADPDTPKVLDKALRVLDAFGDARDRWTEADLRRHLGMPSSSLNRILRGLERAGYVLRDDAGAYRLGIGAVRLGDRARASLDLPAIVDAELRALAQATSELVLLAVAEPALGTALYIAAVDSPQRLRVTAEPGTRVPLTAGATARSLLAFAPDALIEQVLARRREPLAAGNAPRRGRDPRAPGSHPRQRLGEQLAGDVRRRVGARRSAARRGGSSPGLDRGGRPHQPPQRGDRGGDAPGAPARRGPGR